MRMIFKYCDKGNKSYFVGTYHVEYIRIGQLLRIVLNKNGFRGIQNIVIARILLTTPRIAHNRAHYSIQLRELQLGSPKSPHGQDTCCQRVGRWCCWDRWTQQD